MPGPQNSTAVDRGNQTTPADDSQLEHDATAANQAAEDDRQDSLPFDPNTEAIKQWIRDGELGMGNPHVGKIGKIGSMEIIQVVDANTGLVQLGADGLIVMIHGWNLANAVDGQYITLGLCQVVGTQQYVNGLGTTSTVFVMRPLDDGLSAATEPPSKFPRRNSATTTSFISKRNSSGGPKQLGNCAAWNSRNPQRVNS
ncbi:hypothetical protein C5Y96_05870 [Blastopirellula marina]|uniref:Uncharacterized protein n=2 Tax=Pirellulales TaxID=2691354 RepID=A0A2S8G535_9BACT|nr:hypothetical protein C5Y96_05870 [Blastopirellula marina]RCS55689.1 hypothetical protein DTL36_05880 [Bremerella cremea]